ncbi:MAG: lipopolysaccharide core heptose(II) kinase RfaY, partial [archaeon]|nr:lipopolysaccharide core heptose(II) kinase RfaY [archaeon]
MKKALGKEFPYEYPMQVETPSGMKLVIKNAEALKRWRNSYMLDRELKGERGALVSAVMAIGRRVRVESPLASYVDAKKRRFHVFRFVKGTSGQEAFNNQKMSADQKREIGLKIAETIGKMHRVGIWHGHPHMGNFIIDGSRVTVLDTKQMLTKEEVEKRKSKKLFVPAYQEGYEKAKLSEFYHFLHEAWHVIGNYYLFRTPEDFELALNAYFKGLGKRDDYFYQHIRGMAKGLLAGQRLNIE